MDFLTHIREALLNLITSKLRSFLAVLGILVGTSSVVALISSSQLATEHALAQFKSLGINLLAMDVMQREVKGKSSSESQLQLSDMPKLLQSSTQIVSIAPYKNLYQNVTLKGSHFGVQILGGDEKLGEIAKIKLQQGRFVSILDKNNPYCVIGAKLAEKLRQQGINPLNYQLHVGDNYFTVIGIAKPWQPNLFLFSDVDNGIIIPIMATHLLSKEVEINNVLFRLVQRPSLSEVQTALTDTMKRLFPEKEVRFRNPQQIIDIIGKQRQTFTWLLGAIGGISLLVGGIGVMNIMLVSVVERRREIGIRMAIGARRSDILTMFLIEAIILTLFGGFLGIIIGVAISYAISVASAWEFQLYLLPPLLGFAVSVCVGILSGFYPALRASKLDPIRILQGE